MWVQEVSISRKASEVPTEEEVKCWRRSGSLLVSKPGSQWDSGQSRVFQAGKKNHVQSQRRVGMKGPAFFKWINFNALGLSSLWWLAGPPCLRSPEDQSFLRHSVLSCSAGAPSRTAVGSSLAHLHCGVCCPSLTYSLPCPSTNPVFSPWHFPWPLIPSHLPPLGGGLAPARAAGTHGGFLLGRLPEAAGCALVPHKGSALSTERGWCCALVLHTWKASANSLFTGIIS